MRRSLHVGRDDSKKRNGRDDKMRSLHALRLVEMTRGEDGDLSMRYA